MSEGSTGTLSGGASTGALPQQEQSALQNLKRWIRQITHKNEGGLKEALEEVLEEHEDDASPISDEERTLLRNMIAFGELKVVDVMIPRTDICAASIDTSFEDMKASLLEHMHTRIPIYGETLDDIKGFLHLKDFFQCSTGEKSFEVQELMRDILFVPPSMKIVDLLLKMRMTSCHIAIVVDEYGGTDGLVTMEDLFEEIVGEIQDEHDDAIEPEMVWRSEKILEADARVRVEDLSKELDIDLINGHANDDFDTLGGLIFSHLGRIPAKGEVLDYHNTVKLEIMSADPRKIKKVKVVRMQPLASKA